MFHDESWKSIYFGVKRSKVKATSNKNIAGVGVCTLVGAFSFQDAYMANVRFKQLFKKWHTC